LARGKIFRLTYFRGDEVKYVSHLDFVRVFERAARRANIDVAFSDGFNPRMLMVFGNPLPVGVTSECELMDIELASEMDGEELINGLNGELPGNIKVLSYVVLEKPYSTILKTFNAADYIVTISSNDGDFVSKILECYEKEPAFVTMKKSKSGIKEVDIKPLIRKLSKVSENKMLITCTTGQENNLRPELAINTIAEKANISITINSIHKEKMYFI